MKFFRKKSTKVPVAAQRCDSHAVVLEQNAHYRAKIQAMQSLGGCKQVETEVVNPFTDSLRHRLFEALWSAVKENHLERFYNGERVEQLVEKHAPFYPAVQSLCRAWNVEHLTSDFFKLVLYDVVFLCSDGPTMATEERIDDAKASIQYLMEVRKQIYGGSAGGVKVRFVNSSYEHDNMQTSQDVECLFAK
ncbi:hypothetical protein GNI_071030, partial [Gregarina niphandrodes]